MAAQAEIRAATGRRKHDPRRDRSCGDALGSLARVVEAADPADKAEIYADSAEPDLPA